MNTAELLAHIEQAELKPILRGMIATLPPNIQNVLSLRFGFGGSPKTLKKVGWQLGLSTERVRQIEKRGLRILRHPSYSKQLKDFLD